MATKDKKSARSSREIQFALGMKAIDVVAVAGAQASAMVGKESTYEERLWAMAKCAARMAAEHAQASINAVVAAQSVSEADEAADAASWLAGATAKAAEVAIGSTWLAAAKGTEDAIAEAAHAATTEIIDVASKTAAVALKNEEANSGQSAPEPVVAVTTASLVAQSLAEAARVAADGGESMMPPVASILEKFEASLK